MLDMHITCHTLAHTAQRSGSVAMQVDPVMSQRMATWVVWAVTNSHRKMDEFASAQAGKQWLQRAEPPPDNSEVTVTVLGGLGGMGLPASAALSMLGYSVVTCSRSMKNVGKASAIEKAKHITFEQLDELLPTTDVLVCLLPLTDSTRGIISSPLLQKLKRGAAVVNAGRGAHVVEDHLLAALDSGTSVSVCRSHFLHTQSQLLKLDG